MEITRVAALPADLPKGPIPAEKGGAKGVPFRVLAGHPVLQLQIFSEEFPGSASHQLVLITSLPFAHTARRPYRLSDSVNNSEIDFVSFAEHVFRSLVKLATQRKEKSQQGFRR